MLFLYTLVLLLLGVVKFLIDRRAASLERKFARAAREADGLLKAPLVKEGNSSKGDPFQAAKRQYQLGLLVQKRDRLEAKHDAWQARAEKFGAVVEAMRGWKGRKLPYTFGALDVWLALALVDHLGVGEVVSAKAVWQMVVALITQ